MTDPEDGRLMSQNNHLIWFWMPASLVELRWGEVREFFFKSLFILQKFPRMASLGERMC